MKTRTGCILMAAGNASRFGRNKLAMEFRGAPVYEHALSAIPSAELEAVAVVSQYDEILTRARSMGFVTVRNDRPEDGVSRTIRLGMDALLRENELDALMFMVCDQPLLRRESVIRELAFYDEEPDMIASIGHGGRRGNPAIFPRRFFQELLELSEDDGGSRVIKNHPDALRLFQIGDEAELYDVDTASEFARLSEIAAQQDKGKTQA